MDGYFTEADLFRSTHSNLAAGALSLEPFRNYRRRWMAIVELGRQEIQSPDGWARMIPFRHALPVEHEYDLAIDALIDEGRIEVEAYGGRIRLGRRLAV